MLRFKSINSFEVINYKSLHRFSYSDLVIEHMPLSPLVTRLLEAVFTTKAVTILNPHNEKHQSGIEVMQSIVSIQMKQCLVSCYSITIKNTKNYDDVENRIDLSINITS